MRAITIVLVLLTACGGDSGVRTVSGPTSFNGASARFELGIASVAHPDAGTTLANTLEVDVFDVAVWCDPSPPETHPSEYGALTVILLRLYPGPVTTGTYPVGPKDEPLQALAYLIEQRGSEPSLMFPVTDGQAVLSGLTDSVAQGSVDLVLSNGTRLRGDFSATFCPQ